MANRNKPKKISTAQAAGAAIKGLLEMRGRSNTGMAARAAREVRSNRAKIDKALVQASGRKK